MSIFLSYLFRYSGFALLFLGLSLPTLANTRNEGWYQVEMIVFARRNPVSDEHFPKSIKLRYPTRWIDLKDPNQQSPDSPTTNVDFTTEPFWQLPASERSLNNQARTLERNPGYQLLFHQAWRQKISGPRDPSNILITGGRAFGKHYELEGNITLSVATYLKITTNLWFSQFDVNLDTMSSQNDWPEIPLRPNYVKASTTMTLDGDFEKLERTTASFGSIEEEAVEPYKPRLIVLVKQERDMRSNETHYLDHPLLGVIIKIKPYRP